MRVIGIDPGSRFTGFGVVEGQGQSVTCVAHGCIKSTLGNMPSRLATLYQALADTVQEYRPEAGAVEAGFVHHRNVSSALKLGQARGVALAALAGAGLPVAEYAPRDIKLSVVGYGAADKKQVQHMVCQLLGLREVPGEDAADALGIAICHLHRASINARLARAGVPT